MTNFDMAKWQKAKYERYVLLLDKNTEKALITKIEAEKKKGFSANQAIKNLIK